MSFGLDREVERFESTVPTDVSKIQHEDAIVFDIADDVGFREFLGRLSKGLNERVGAKRHRVGRQHESLLFEHDWLHTIVTHSDATRQPEHNSSDTVTHRETTPPL